MISDDWKPRLQDVSAFMGAKVQMLRLDEIHPVVSGNKWFKLKENIAAAKAEGKNHLVTFGGAYSNHLVATAAAAKAFGMRATGIVRGEDAAAAGNHTLRACSAYSMELRFVSRSDYRQKTSPGFIDTLRQEFSEDIYIIPEGGANAAGVQGASLISKWITASATHVAVSVGTGATLAGMLQTMRRDVITWGYCATSNHEEQFKAIQAWAPKRPSFSMGSERQFGGFGKWNQQLLDFMQDFYGATGIPLDVVYTGKMMYAVRQHILDWKDFSDDPEWEGFNNMDIVCIHTGGLQGNPAGLFGV